MPLLRIQMFSRVILTLMALATFCGQSLSAMPPPSKQMIEAYKKDGSWARRLANAKALGNNRVDPDLAMRATQRLQRITQTQGLGLAKDTVLPTPPSGARGLPTKGSPKIFILMIDFSDFPADDVNTQAAVTARIFGNGDGVQAAPYESLKSYYYRSSYGQLTFTGNVLPTYRPPYTRASMGENPTTTQRQNLIKDALAYHVALGHDFAQYDNNGDGKIDYFAVLWTGPDNGWSNFWWAYKTGWGGPSPVLNGKTLGVYVWQWFANKNQGTRNYPNFDPKVLCHETGHALGLPDYYDYDDTKGPNGGIGGLDLMDSGKGDHNCFSKWLLDWITPVVYTNTTNQVSLHASGNTGDAMILMDTDPGSTFGEYFMVQNRQRVVGSNDASASFPADGALIWHVDARLNADQNDFEFDNSSTSHKLLRLMEADGRETIETGGGLADASDYFIQGKDFGPATAPNSSSYTGVVTRMGVKNFSVPSANMTMDVYKVTDTTAPTGVPTKPTGTTTLDTVTFTWTPGSAADLESGIGGFLLQVGTTPGGSDVFNLGVGNTLVRTLTNLGQYDGMPLYARVAAMNGGGVASAWSEISDAVTLALPGFPAEVLESTLLFKTLGPWTTDTNILYSGPSSARSAVIADMATTYLQTRVNGPGTLDFFWKVRSELDYDYLTFSIDGVAQPGAISGTTMTDFVKSPAFTIPAGSHLLRWTYTKDLNTAPDQDGAWVDFLTWNTSTAAKAVVSPAAITTVTGGTVTYTAAVTNSTLNSVNWTVAGNAGTFSATPTAANVPTTFTAGATAGSFTVTATPVEVDGLAGTSSLTLVAPSSVAVTLTSVPANVSVGAVVTLTPTVSLLTDKTVTWTSTGGTFGNQTGAVATWSSAVAGTFTLTATSTVAPTRMGSVTVTVINTGSISLIMEPITKTLLPGGSFAFTITGDQGYGVDWTLTGVGATKVDQGLQSVVTMPSAAPTATLTYSLKAASKADASRTATATITVKNQDGNGDGIFDPRDLLLMAREWGKDATSPANFKGTGTVDETDLNTLLGRMQ